ncbi:MAG: hypothetical protein ACKODS_06450, partial [Methylophilaceae bacterium]
IGISPEQTIAVKLWNGERCICTNDYSIVKADLDRESRNAGYSVPCAWSKEDKIRNELWEEINQELVKNAERSFSYASRDKRFARRNAVREATETLKRYEEQTSKGPAKQTNEQMNLTLQ